MFFPIYLTTSWVDNVQNSEYNESTSITFINKAISEPDVRYKKSSSSPISIFMGQGITAQKQPVESRELINLSVSPEK